MTPLCPRHQSQIETTHNVWPHLGQTELDTRAKIIRLWCLDCQGAPRLVQHLPRDLEETP